MQVLIDYVGDPRPVEIHRFSRVPCLGEMLSTEDQTWSVKKVLHLLDAQDGKPVALIQVFPDQCEHDATLRE